MVEFTLAGIAMTAMTEGVRFLYGQAAELIKSWRAGRKERTAQPPAPEVPAGVFAGEPRLANPDLAVVERREDTVEGLLLAPELVRVVHGHDRGRQHPDHDVLQERSKQSSRWL